VSVDALTWISLPVRNHWVELCSKFRTEILRGLISDEVYGTLEDSKYIWLRSAFRGLSAQDLEAQQIWQG